MGCLSAILVGCLWGTIVVVFNVKGSAGTFLLFVQCLWGCWLKKALENSAIQVLEAKKK